MSELPRDALQHGIDARFDVLAQLDRRVEAALREVQRRSWSELRESRHGRARGRPAPAGAAAVSPPREAPMPPPRRSLQTRPRRAAPRRRSRKPPKAAGRQSAAAAEPRPGANAARHG